jgi:hypothetical protein
MPPVRVVTERIACPHLGCRYSFRRTSWYIKHLHEKHDGALPQPIQHASSPRPKSHLSSQHRSGQGISFDIEDDREDISDGDAMDIEDVSDEDLDLPREFIIPEPMSPGYDPDLDDEEEDEAPLNENQLALEPCNTVEKHTSAGISYGDVPDYDTTELHKNPWMPFKSADDFQQAA